MVLQLNELIEERERYSPYPAAIALSVPECCGLPMENTSVGVSGLKNVFFTFASWLEEISRRQADLLTTQAARMCTQTYCRKCCTQGTHGVF